MSSAKHLSAFVAALSVLSLAVLTATPAAAGRLDDLMKQTGLKYRAQDDATCVAMYQGQTGDTAVIVSDRDAWICAYTVLMELEEAKVPGQFWKLIADLGARPWLPHVGYVQGEGGKGYLITVAAYPAASITPQVVKDLVENVFGMSDQLLPQLRQMLTVQ